MSGDKTVDRVGAGLATGGLSEVGLLGKDLLTQKPPEFNAPPVPEEPAATPMADPDDVLLKKRKRQAAAQGMQARTGLQSTLLSEAANKGGLG